MKKSIPEATFTRSYSVSDVVITRKDVEITVPASRLTRDGGIPASLRQAVRDIAAATTTLSDAIRLSVMHGIEIAPR